MFVSHIVSGGQTGVDRAALDVAMDLGISHGGWCPKGRLAEDGPIPDDYQLKEMPSPDYAVRTEQNVVDSDGTLILFVKTMSGGTKLTWKLARKHSRSLISFDLESIDLNLAVAEFRSWLEKENVGVINVAGPRESSEPGIGQRAANFLQVALSE